ncbi:hypothetical protein WMY93_006233 [Mugilogobius chulae]|uniref:Uncharacterized protein n=1 Tax=Mugilogobius chulae TaxID=88201 RepID=A0AAW0PYM9_9GOBI
MEDNQEQLEYIQALKEAYEKRPAKKFLQEKQEQHANIQALEEVHAKSVEDAHILLQLIKDKEEMNDTLRETVNYKDTTIDLLRQKNASLQEEIRTVMDASRKFLEATQEQAENIQAMKDAYEKSVEDRQTMTEIIKEEKQSNRHDLEPSRGDKKKTEVRKKSLVEVESQGEKEKARNQDVSENLKKKDMLSGVLEEMNRHVKEEMQALKEACKKSIEEERERLDKNENPKSQKVSESLKVEGMTISIVNQKIVGLQEEQQTSREVYQSLTQLENVQSVNKDLEKVETTKLQNVLTDIEGTEPKPTDFPITAQEKVFT